METNYAKETVRDITADILENRGDMSLAQVRKWASVYTNWAAACDALTADEVEDAMLAGLESRNGNTARLSSAFQAER